MINICTKLEFNPSTSWGSYARHRHHLLHGARSTTDIKPWHKHTTGELKILKLLVLKSTRQTCGKSFVIIKHRMEKVGLVSFRRFSCSSVKTEYVFTRPGEVSSILQDQHYHTIHRGTCKVGELMEHMDGNVFIMVKP